MTTQVQPQVQTVPATTRLRYIRQSDGFCFGCRRTGQTFLATPASPWCDECTGRTLERGGPLGWQERFL